MKLMLRTKQIRWYRRKNLALKVGLFSKSLCSFLIVPERMQVLRPTYLGLNLGSAISLWSV